MLQGIERGEGLIGPLGLVGATGLFALFAADCWPLSFFSLFPVPRLRCSARLPTLR